MEQRYAGGEVIFREGDQGDCLYEVVSGSVEIYADYESASQRMITKIEPGHIFGELALIDGLPRSATAVAFDDVTLYEVEPDEFKSYFDSRPERVTSLIREIGERITRLSGDIAEVKTLLNKTSDEEAVKNPGFMDKIKQYAADYTMKKKSAKVSAESKKAASMKEGDNGFSKTVSTYNKGDVIFREGEPARCMYNVQTGWVDIYTGYGTPDETLISTVGIATFFGEIGLISGSVRSATAVAGMDRCMVESFTLEDFEELYTQNRLKVQRSIEYLAERVRLLTVQYLDACKMAYLFCEGKEGTE